MIARLRTAIADPRLRRPGPPLARAARRVPGLLVLPGPGGWLGIALAALVLVAAFDSGGFGLGREAYYQVALAVLGALAAVGIAAGVLRAPRDLGVWTVVGLLALLASWAALGVGASVLPDQTWLAANRIVAYAVAVGLGFVVAASVPRAPVYAAWGLVAVVVPVALYALAGKVFPGIVDHVGEFPRVREPIGYANGLGLLIVLATPAPLLVAASRGRDERLRAAAVALLGLLVLAAGLTLSRGSYIALLIVVATLVAAGPDRLPRLGFAALAGIAAAPALIYNGTAEDLTGFFVPVEDRVGDGLILGLLALAGLVGSAAGAIASIRAARRAGPRPDLRRTVVRGLVALTCVGLLVGVGVAATSDRGLRGTVSSVLEVSDDPASQARPERVLTGDASNRTSWWRESLAGWWERPVRGWGGGSFLVVHRLYRDEPFGVRQPHSVPLQFLVETGTVGFLLYLGAMGLLLAGAALSVRASHGIDRSARLALLAAGVAWFLHGTIDWDWDIPAVSLPALIVLAIAAVPPGGGTATGGIGALARPAARGGLAVAGVLVALVVGVSSALPKLAEDRRREALAIAGQPNRDEADLERAAERAVLATRLNPLAVEPLFTLATIEASRGRLEEQYVRAVEAARLQPYNVRTWSTLIQAQTAVGDRRFTELALRRLVETDPLVADRAAGLGLATFITPPVLSPTAGATPLPPVTVPPDEDEEQPADAGPPPAG